MGFSALLAAAALAATGPGVASAPSVATSLPPVAAPLWRVTWQRELVPPGLLEWRPQELGGPVVPPASGLVLVGTRDGWLHARTPDGERVWDAQVNGRVDGAPFVKGDAVYAGSSDGKLYAFDLATGKQRWAYDAQEEVGTTPAVAGSVVLAMTLQDTLVAVDARTGVFRWNHRRAGKEGFSIRGAASVVVANGLAVAGYSDGMVAALEVETGAVRWERRVAPTGDFMDVDGLAVQGGRVFVAAYSGGVYALDVATGDERWRAQAPGASRVAVSEGLAVAVTPTQVLGIATRDGAVRWKVPLDGVPAGVPSFSGPLVAVPKGDGLLVIDAVGGRALRSLDPGTGVSSPAAWDGNRFYVLSNEGELYALDLT